MIPNVNSTLVFSSQTNSKSNLLKHTNHAKGNRKLGAMPYKLKLNQRWQLPVLALERVEEI